MYIKMKYNEIYFLCLIIIYMEYIQKQNGFIKDLLKDDFFNSLKTDYKEFSQWYMDAIDDANKASFYWLEDKKVIAFLGLKVEDESFAIGKNIFPKKKRIKITTMKSTIDLPRFSEVVFYKAIKKAIEEETKDIYFSVIPNSDNKQKLLEIAKSFGFKKIGRTKMSKNGIERKDEEVYLLKTIGEKSSNWKKSYPLLPEKDNRRCQLLTIGLKYHDDFLQDAEVSKVKQNHDFSKMSIKKAYVHNQGGTAQLQMGDMAFLYRISDLPNKTFHSVITSYGVIIEQKTKNVDYKTYQEFKTIVKNIHAFDSKNESELKGWYNNNKYITIFGFIRAFGEGRNVNHKWLSTNNLFFGKGPGTPYGKTISQEQVVNILKQAGISVKTTKKEKTHV